MKKLHIIGLIILAATIVGFILWHFTVSLPDWFVRVNGVLMLIFIFITVFSTTKISMKKK